MSALNNLGVIYHGEDNYTEAIKFYRMALNNGEILSAYNLGNVYIELAKKSDNEYDAFDNYMLAIKHIKKGMSIHIPLPLTTHAEFLKTRYECAKLGIKSCKKITDMMISNDHLGKECDIITFLDIHKDLITEASALSKEAIEKYGMDIEKIKW